MKQVAHQFPVLGLAGLAANEALDLFQIGMPFFRAFHGGSPFLVFRKVEHVEHGSSASAPHLLIHSIQQVQGLAEVAL